MNTEKKIKLFIEGMSRYIKKLPFVIEFKIDEEQVRKIFEQNLDR